MKFVNLEENIFVYARIVKTDTNIIKATVLLVAFPHVLAVDLFALYTSHIACRHRYYWPA